MALVWSFHAPPKPIIITTTTSNNTRLSLPRSFRSRYGRGRFYLSVVNELGKQSDPTTSPGNDNEDFGVKVALSVLRFYKSEISPLLPKSCRYIPTCSEYSMIAYKKYGVAKGSILTVWRICRCNPLGGSGFDPPRWFDEPSPPEPEE
uniref:UPF0161 protein At3g09310 n=1 Tax=Erigeron canadensis TaxID=72917 RepID=UPI001CB96E3F|nr:UPF0161 protein At3g09310 [Erigeron canadensis]